MFTFRCAKVLLFIDIHKSIGNISAIYLKNPNSSCEYPIVFAPLRHYAIFLDAANVKSATLVKITKKKIQAKVKISADY